MRKSKYNSFDELPLMLTVEDVSHVLGIGLAHAYEVATAGISPPSHWEAASSFPVTNSWNGSTNRLRKNLKYFSSYSKNSVVCVCIKKEGS